MKHATLAIIAGAIVTVLGYLFLASAILPDGIDDLIPADVVSDDTGSHSEIKRQAQVQLQEREFRELNCAPIKARLQTLLDKSRHCETTADCAVVSLGCPFGCAGGYNKSAESAIIKDVKAYQTQCHSCIYTCPAPSYEWHAECLNSKCMVVDRPAFRTQQSPSG